jgi:hypothetical protein
MHVRKACEELWNLAADAPANITTFVSASVLLDQLNEDNQDIEIGWRVNGTVREKLSRARRWFEILCGVGEDGAWPERDLRDFIMQDLSVVKNQIKTDDESPSSHFKHWPPV